MSTTAPVFDPLNQYQPPPPFDMTQRAYRSKMDNGSVGPVIGVLAVIAILATMAVVIGRLCSGRSIRGERQYDMEAWAETKCGPCIDGRVGPPPQPQPQQPQTPQAPAPAAGQQAASSSNSGGGGRGKKGKGKGKAKVGEGPGAAPAPPAEENDEEGDEIQPEKE